VQVSVEPYYSVKRDLLQCQKRPTTVSKETYYSVKRHLLQYRDPASPISLHRFMCYNIQSLNRINTLTAATSFKTNPGTSRYTPQYHGCGAL
jgi:hypothetical protein